MAIVQGLGFGSESGRCLVNDFQAKLLVAMMNKLQD
jgi:hypothetical protein